MSVEQKRKIFRILEDQGFKSWGRGPDFALEHFGRAVTEATGRYLFLSKETSPPFYRNRYSFFGFRESCCDYVSTALFDGVWYAVSFRLPLGKTACSVPGEKVLYLPFASLEEFFGAVKGGGDAIAYLSSRPHDRGEYVKRFGGDLCSFGGLEMCGGNSGLGGRDF